MRSFPHVCFRQVHFRTFIWHTRHAASLQTIWVEGIADAGGVADAIALKCDPTGGIIYTLYFNLYTPYYYCTSLTIR